MNMSKAQNADEYIAQQRMALASNAECGATHYNLAVALMGQKKYEEAESHLHEAISCSPNLAEAFVQLGGICLQRGDVEGCLHYNKRSIKARAGFAPGYANIGFLELQNGNVDEAIKNLQKAIVFNSRHIQAYTTLASALLAKGLVDECIEACMKAIEIQPDFPISYNNLAVAYLEKKDYEKAIENADKAESLGYPIAEGLKKELEAYRRT
ncbi:tetratricopeptide repeat protein [Desulfobotulus sp.]|jgi:tetratricopeptide (TPR) repeat protein|uniref:tetratricopeptide repeat protein n=1 Tax=Desulfobotulus sp. TaxID=1940337 RepID=UPI002A35A09E|nr:tetratricopeptide repeat protein [Desulfobotulus sp.]MDY0163773.1 tetratricopeptide repeat protein [Desulfobotulus sp.]